MLCTGMDRSGELEKVECCFAAVVGLPTQAVRDQGPTHHLASNKQEQAHRARRSRSAAPALPMTSETLVDEAEGRKTINKFGVRVFIIKNTCNVHTILLSLGHKAACVWGFQCLVYGACASSASAVLPLWSDRPPLPVIDRGPNTTMSLARWQGTSAPSTKNHDVCFRSNLPAFLTTMESLSQSSDRVSM